MGTEVDFNYGRYLASREWALLKEKLRIRSQGWCERCCVGKYQETHHLTYERVGREKLEDLQAVCSPCHRFLSAKSDQDPARDVAVVVVAFDFKKTTFSQLWHSLDGIHGIRLVGTTSSVKFNRIFGINNLPDWADSGDSLVGDYDWKSKIPEGAE